MDHILVRVKRCRHCDSEMQVSGESYAENPFCSGCLHERIGYGEQAPALRFLHAHEHMMNVHADAYRALAKGE